jgi:hypothetical protein
MDASLRLMALTQKEELKGDKGLASPQTRNSGSIAQQERLQISVMRNGEGTFVVLRR